MIPRRSTAFLAGSLFSGIGLAGILLTGILLADVFLARAACADTIGPVGLRGLKHTRSADGSGRGALTVGTFTNFHTLDDTTGTSYRFWVTEVQAGYGVSKELELGVALPLRSWSARGGSSQPQPSSDIGFGDLRAAAKLQLPLPWRRLHLGGRGEVSFPTGSGSRGMSSNATDAELGGLVTADFTRLQGFIPTRLHFDIAYRWNRNEARGTGMAPLDSLAAGGFWPPAYPAQRIGGTTEFNDVLAWRTGIDFDTGRAGLFVEFTVDDYRGVPDTDWLDNPVLLTPGAVVHFRNGIDFVGAVDISLQEDDPPVELPRVPEWRLTLGLTYRMGLALGDGDRDGIPAKRDSCPDTAEDFDGFKDEDGCPDLDNDGDGVPDEQDLAPDLVEDFDGFEDTDGRPDMDNDADGNPDDRDQCPNEPEDYDGVSDIDGCPEEASLVPQAVPPAPTQPTPQNPPPSPAPQNPPPPPGTPPVQDPSPSPGTPPAQDPPPSPDSPPKPS